MKTLLLVMAGCLMAISAAASSDSFDGFIVPNQTIQQETDTPNESAGAISPGWLIFDAGSARLSQTMQQNLSKLGMQMQSMPGARVVIVTQGGGTGTQQKLNEERANAVVTFISANYGIPATSFSSTVSDGIDDPNAINFHQDP